MATNVLLPQWGVDMEDGLLLKWLVREGDRVEPGQPLAEIETATFESEVEAPVSGTVARIVVAQGSTADVGTVLAVIAGPGEAVRRPEGEPPRPDALPNGAAGAVVKTTGSEYAVPAAEVLPMNRMRRTIAARMMRSVQSMAQVTLTTEADVTDLVLLREGLVQEWRPHRIRPVDLDLVVKATAASLKEHPRMNATLGDDELRLLGAVNVGVAVSVEGGLVVPVIRGADGMDLLSIARRLRSVASRSRSGGLTVNDLTGATFTITTLAGFDIDAFTPIIDPPQVGILGVGRIAEKPAVYEGRIAVRSMMSLSLTFDHRALDGVPAGEFLQEVKGRLEEPAWMVSAGAGGPAG